MARTHTTGSGIVLELIRQGVSTRHDLLEHLGWSRVTLARRLDELLSHGLIVQSGHQASGGGRPRESFAVNATAGLLLALDIGGSHTRVGVTDLVSEILSEDEADIGLFEGPGHIIAWAGRVFHKMLQKQGRNRNDVWGIGVGVPGPVDPTTGQLGAPQIDPRWDNVSIPERVAHWGRPGAVVAVDRDVNVLAVGEARLAWPDASDLVVVKVGSGVGCAFVLDGKVYRGNRGGSGELSAPLGMHPSVPLRRFDSVAGGALIRDKLNLTGTRLHTSLDIVSLVKAGDKEATALVRDLGVQLGYTLADVVGLLNPAAVVVGGNLATIGEPFIGAIRRSVFAASHVFARQGLVVEGARLGVHAGVQGAALIAQDKLFDADRISELTHG